mgnify:FL=1
MPTLQTKIKHTREKGIFIPAYYLESIESALQEIIAHQDLTSHEYSASKLRITNRAKEVMDWLKSARTLTK